MTFDSIFYNMANKRILDGVFLKVERGKICGLYGRNGSGKSTLIKIGAGLVLPTSGTVFIDGQAFLKKSRMSRYKKISYLCQESFLPKDLTVRKIIHACSRKKEHDFIYQNVNPTLLDQKVRSLSGGERKLFELILILSLNRSYILLDEPFTGLEPKIIEKMMDLIFQQRDQGKGILITDHYFRYVSQIVDVAYLLKDGTCRFMSDMNSIKDEMYEFGYFGM